MKSNVDKCKDLHVGYSNSKTTYKMGGKDLGTVTEIEDLGVIISENLKVSKQCHTAAKKGNQEKFFTRSADSRRGHEYKLFKWRFRLGVGKFRFGNRVINDWNRLPESGWSRQY